MLSQDVKRAVETAGATEHVHRAANHLAADVDAVDAGLKELVKEMHEQLGTE